MSEKFIAIDLLKSFELIYQHGTHDPGSGNRRFGSLVVSTGHDGYTLTLANDQASVTVGFHNTLSFSTTNKRALEALRADIRKATLELSDDW